MILNSEVLQLQQVAGFLIVTIVILLAVLRMNRPVKTALSVLAMLLTTIHYLILLEISSYVVIHIYPLFIVEEAYIRSIGSTRGVFYPDVGQLSILLLILVWRRELARAVLRVLERVQSSPRNRQPCDLQDN